MTIVAGSSTAASLGAGSMTLLQLAQATKRESGLTGGGPVAYASAAGDDARIFGWVIWAWRDIDLMHEAWLWRRVSATATTAGSKTLSPTEFALTDFGSWLMPTREYRPTAYKVSDGQQNEKPLAYLGYDLFRQRFLVGVHAAGPLQCWTIAPNGDMLVGPTPDADHVVNADYIRAHVPLAADSDVPLLPSSFHPLIYWYALREYGGYDAAGEVWQRADRNFKSGYSGLAQSQLPKMRWGGRPLA